MLDVFEVQASALGSLQGKLTGERDSQEIPLRFNIMPYLAEALWDNGTDHAPWLALTIWSMKASIDLLVEVGQTFDWINPCEWPVFSSRNNQRLRLSLDILLLVFGAWQRKSNIDSSQQQLKSGSFPSPGKFPHPSSVSLLQEGDSPASASTEPKQLSFDCGFL